MATTSSTSSNSEQVPNLRKLPSQDQTALKQSNSITNSETDKLPNKATSRTLDAHAVKKPEKISAWVRSISSHAAGLISVTLCFPLEVIKTRMQI